MEVDSRQEDQQPSKGGMKTMPFIIANETIEMVGSVGLRPNMIKYLTGDYHLSVATGNSILFLWGAATHFFTAVGGFLSDSYLGRFTVICLGSMTAFTGVTLLWLTAMIPGVKPPPCNPPHESCESPTPSQLALLVTSFLIMSLGAGGVRPCSMAFGADQIKDSPGKERALQSYFNWYYTSLGVSIMISTTVIVYLQDHKGWKFGFGVSVILMFLAAIFFSLGSPLYVKMESNRGLFLGLAQVMVAAFRNRDLEFPPENGYERYHQSKGSKLLAPTGKMRCLNKACIIRDHEKDLTLDGSASKPWSLCTVDQVEDLKSLVKVIPIWSTGIMVYVLLTQNFLPLEANTMDRHLGPTFQIPSGSFGVFAVFTLTVWVTTYDRIITPLVGKLPYKQRMGIGILLSSMAVAVAGFVEHHRRRVAIREGKADNAGALVNMSAMWFLPHLVLSGLAEAFNFIGQLEFYYNELPKSMASIAIALFSLGGGVASIVASLILKLVEEMSSIGGKESWVASNFNKGHLDYYYWFLAVLGFINFPYFLLCSWAYGPCKGESSGVEGREKKKEEET